MQRTCAYAAYILVPAEHSLMLVPPINGVTVTILCVNQYPLALMMIMCTCVTVTYLTLVQNMNVCGHRNWFTYLFS